jgi:transcriptional regulator with XRE-family HTH domain
MTPEHKLFGQLLHNERMRAGKTLGELSQVLGISVSHLDDVEGGVADIGSSSGCIDRAVEVMATPVNLAYELRSAWLKCGVYEERADANLDLIAELVRVICRDGGGYMRPEDQAILEVARGRLRDSGRAAVEWKRRSTR